MSKLKLKESKNDFSIYGVFRFSTYIVCSFALYFGNLEIAGVAFGFVKYRSKKITFHIKHKLKPFTYVGHSFYAKDQEEADLYIKRLESIKKKYSECNT